MNLIRSHLEISELKHFFQLGFEKEDQELAELMIKEADLNKDGIISIKEFQLVMNIFGKKIILNS